jgi:hypothetical protein
VKTSVAEYLAQAYESDAEYVDGEVIERDGGEFDHSRLQSLIAPALGQFEQTHQLYTLIAQKIRIATERYRIPLALLRPFR